LLASAGPVTGLLASAGPAAGLATSKVGGAAEGACGVTKPGRSAGTEPAVPAEAVAAGSAALVTGADAPAVVAPTVPSAPMQAACDGASYGAGLHPLEDIATRDGRAGRADERSSPGRGDRAGNYPAKCATCINADIGKEPSNRSTQAASADDGAQRRDGRASSEDHRGDAQDDGQDFA
jgi:hypothetical protein